MWFLSPSPEHTHRAAAALARALAGRDAVLALSGPLGAGKTAFVKGLAEGLGLDPGGVGSPTFVIASEYPLPGGRRLAHADLYRVADGDELEAAGFLDLLVPGVVLAVEWADRIPDALPRDRLEIHLGRDAEAPDSQRRIAVRADAALARAQADRWSAVLAAEGFAVHARYSA